MVPGPRQGEPFAVGSDDFPAKHPTWMSAWHITAIIFEFLLNVHPAVANIEALVACNVTDAPLTPKTFKAFSSARKPSMVDQLIALQIASSNERSAAG